MRPTIEQLAYWLQFVPDSGSMTIRALAEDFGVDPERIRDALDCLKMKRGWPTQLPPVPWGNCGRCRVCNAACDSAGDCIGEDEHELTSTALPEHIATALRTRLEEYQAKSDGL